MRTNLVTKDTISAFDQLALSQPILKALDAVGYETPSPIQARTIPLLLEGRDMVGQAQTGTGKTAAFALPALSTLDLKQKDPQVLVLAPTRELAIQVAEAFGKYANHMKGFHVLPVYGGQDYRVQTRALERGVHVVVGTPGRIMDHIRRGNLKLNNLKMLILDEADEMLRMGFIDDVEWILDQTPEQRQIALFSATMPAQIRRIANKYLREPEHITIEVKTTTAETIRQRYWPVTGRNKLDALTRILEAEDFDAMLIFVRTKIATTELSEKLEARGYACAPLNGDIQQKLRERTVDQLKKGKLDVIVATDVAARGLDVQRISHVLNYDIPYDTEAYVHRIGRTGRAGRSGDAIMFVAPREKRMLQSIERATGKTIEIMEIPSSEIINKGRIEKFKQRITDTIENDDLNFYTKLISDYTKDNDAAPEQVAAALAYLLQGDTPFLFPTQSADRKKDSRRREKVDTRPPREPVLHERSNAKRTAEATRRPNETRTTHDAGISQPRQPKEKPVREKATSATGTTAGPVSTVADKPKKEAVEMPGMERFRLEVGKDHGAEVANIVGAIANEAGIDSQYIGTVRIKETHSFIDLPEGMPKAIFKDLKKVWVCGQKLQISKVGQTTSPMADRSAAKNPRANAKTEAPRPSKRKPDSKKSTDSNNTVQKNPGNKLSVKRRSSTAETDTKGKRVTRSRNINKKRQTRTTD